MFTILITFHVVVCLTLIVVVLLQSGKGAGMGAAFGGGGGQALFSSMGRKDFMARLTTTLAIVFMVTSLVLGIYTARYGLQSSLGKQIEASAGTSAESAPEAAKVPAASE
jgi:preprotein translocase subunit SecG